MNLLSRIDRRIISIWLPCLLMAIPVVIYWSAVFKYTADIPWRDDFDAALVFMNRFVTLPSLWDKLGLILSQHNEHRIVLNRIVFLASYFVLQKVNFNVAILFGNTCWLICAGALIFYIHRRYSVPAWYLVPLPILLFSYVLADPMLFAMVSVQMYGYVLFCILCFICLSEGWIIWASLLIPLATYSSGGGIVLFPVGAVFLIANRQWRNLAIFSAIGLLSTALYFTNYNFGNTGDISQALVDPLRTLTFFFMFLGGIDPQLDPLYKPSLSFPLGIILLVAAAFLIIRRRKIDFLALLVGLACATAILTSISRSDFALDRALISRYKIFSMLLFTAVYIYAVISIKREVVVRTMVAVMVVALTAYWFRAFDQMELSRKLYWQRKYRLTDIALYVTDGVISELSYGKNTDEDHAIAAGILDEAKRLGVYDPRVAVDALNKKN